MWHSSLRRSIALRRIHGLLLHASLTVGTASLLIAPAVLATPQPLHYVAPPPPPGSDRGSPTRQIDMGTRSPCGNFAAVNQFLTALIPKSQPVFTVSERPTFWVYIPYTSSEVESINFSLGRDGSATLIGLRPPDRPGIISIALPNDAPPLEIGQTYQWSVSVSCQSNPSEPLFVEGSIQRVAIDPTLAGSLAAASPHEQAQLYAENGIWYDALTTLGNLYRTEPVNAELASDWASLLSALEIDLRDRGIDFDTRNIVASPIVN
ncbi:DUF928 domain-containing protein [Microcoleus sp. FACHB-1515]|uniref:DUF928 domain-containing protein n=1 Tax=Cyanophyceae TaxID=3028117 RepID=UPI001683E55A|nr:DUF928 domain-containing protein [Microcoleus sp. FACHB-1515]MBD2092537.1 DUF928 domain-containing protein [Microcoleus sp. FACHB-1515]